ncbi:hypothetical protein HCDG_01314 [Histoplasma capsulatum H143]|uniref:Uncharacterized protein n=1 Tax=Ajellomyces capsulatus (strain H143) TaxID=544712 RepID=C6H3Z3_AJECH|nr:hypothetical protein HCDG_01314 [Histoplasma capsulatum H143]
MMSTCRRPRLSISIERNLCLPATIHRCTQAPSFRACCPRARQLERMASWLLLGPADEAPKWLAEVALTPWQDKPTRAVAAAEEGHLRCLVYPVCIAMHRVGSLTRRRGAVLTAMR